ncbi:MAG: glycosyltransferase family 4 protein [bacterium]
MSRVLMLGWEFPPQVSGGLGVACAEISRALIQRGMDILLVLPRPARHRPAGSALKIVTMQDYAARGLTLPQLRMRAVDSLLRPYLSRAGYQKLAATSGLHGVALPPELYGSDLFAEVRRYARLVVAIARTESFDLIHVHDWMTIPAALAVQKISRRPLVLHIHSLESDRSGAHADPAIVALERRGMEAADRVIAVSSRTREQIMSEYDILPEKVVVVHNAVPHRIRRRDNSAGVAVRRRHRQVLFLGRLTHQKGPEYFVQAAARVLAVMPKVTFIMAGAGDMLPALVEEVSRLRLGRHFRFTGFLRAAEVEALFAEADVYVMPSVSEPFGLAPLEAMAHNVPVIVSREAGVCEVLRHALKVNFWDVDDIANQILAALLHPALARELVRNGHADLKKLRWTAVAEKIMNVYRNLSR